jgi:hypothetical protein
MTPAEAEAAVEKWKTKQQEREETIEADTLAAQEEAKVNAAAKAEQVRMVVIDAQEVSAKVNAAAKAEQVRKV